MELTTYDVATDAGEIGGLNTLTYLSSVWPAHQALWPRGSLGHHAECFLHQIWVSVWYHDITDRGESQAETDVKDLPAVSLYQVETAWLWGRPVG